MYNNSLNGDDFFSLIKKQYISDKIDIRSYCTCLEHIIDNTPDGIYINDGDANAILINKAFEKISGLDRNQLLGTNHRDLVKNGIIIKSGALEVLETKKEFTFIQKYLTTGREALITCTPIFDKSGNIVMIISSLRDLTELNVLKARCDEEEELRQRYEKQLELIKDKNNKSDFLIANDEKMDNVLMVANKMSQVESNVLITGESGVGKEIIAKYIHTNGNRANGPFIAINCGALPESLIESELFGYEDGAFTGAKKGGKAGLFEVAKDGTLFLDEIGELPLNIQVRLLRCIQDKKVTRLGSTKEIPINVRLISATNKNLKEMAENGAFRDDLYYRLCVVPIHIPPLRDRIRDIRPLADYYINFFNEQYGLNKSLSQSAYRLMFSYKWPGNVRELKNMIERVVVTSETNLILPKDLPIYNDTKNVINVEYSGQSLKEQVERFEYEQINLAYEKYKNVRAAAEYLGMSEPTYVRKRKQYKEKYS
ncbi:MAG: sigma 54-interacting transcriptional regulator [Firmicutes bacterium]|nr:sigma 54-interacting transcriptional regulator [Bacillota bacterium]